MKRSVLGAVLALVCVILAPREVSATVIDFESLAHAGATYVYVGTTYSEDGFTFEQPGIQLFQFAVRSSNETEYAGSTAMFNDTALGTTRLTFSGGAFSIQSIDLALLNGPGSADVTFTGVRSDASVIVQVFTVTSFQSLTTFNFGAGFTDLVTLDWLQEPEFHQFDNLVVNAPVPEPGVLALLGVGLAGIARRRRNRR